MKIISFDIGIKNMAYCIFEIPPNGEEIQIIDWTILNLMEKEEASISQKCSQSTAILRKSVDFPKCTKLAKYRKGEEYYCACHAKKSKFILPTKNNSVSYIRKLNREELINFCQTHFITIDSPQLAKCKILEKVILYLQTNVLDSIMIKTKKTASETDLICIGKNMKIILDKIPNIQFITHVVIENQISPIATRMKTIQGMLAQYFIMKCSPEICIDFVSSSNKLKGMTQPNVELNKTEKSKYKQNKKNGILFCSQFLQSNIQFKEWDWTMKLQKKDDYADAFLQCIWYLKHQKIIYYDEMNENKMISRVPANS